MGDLCTQSCGFYLITQIFWAQSEATIKLGQPKGVDWHYFCATCTEIRVKDDFLGPLSINDFFSVQFTLKSFHKWLKLFSDTFVTISDPKKNLGKKLLSLAVVHCSPLVLGGYRYQHGSRSDISQDSETESLLGRMGIDSRYVTLSPERWNKLNFDLYLNKSPTYNE
jgi:hypothetical protein